MTTRRGFTPLEIAEKEMRDKTSLTGFTFIEILITLTVVGVLFIPMMQLFSHSLYSVAISGDMITAVNLSRYEMERIKNLNLSKFQLKKQGDVWTPKLEEPPLKINNANWRTLRHLKAGSDPLEVTVEVYTADNLHKPVASLVTLIEDAVWIESGEELQ